MESFCRTIGFSECGKEARVDENSSCCRPARSLFNTRQVVKLHAQNGELLPLNDLRCVEVQPQIIN